MGWFGTTPEWLSSKSRAERAELRKVKKRSKSISEARKRDEEIGRLQDKIRLEKTRQQYKSLKKKPRSKPLVEISIGRKKQGRKLSRKSRIRLI